eukprot:Rhum_TRINITY_DN13406_c0_g1::Rhum_TRINITY_DN13406_c0_g1_i1::g.59898::m.59898
MATAVALSATDMQNQIGIYAADMMRSERMRAEGAGLSSAVKSAIEGNAVYLPSFLGEAEAHEAMTQIIEELMEHVREVEQRDVTSLEDTGLVAWSKHCKHEDPSFSKTFAKVVARMEKHFDTSAFATRLNVYRDGTDWKPLHHDSHAYHHGAGSKEDFTMGLSFGCKRDLEFMHVASETKFMFPQASGDCFAFTSVANKEFMHGVPKDPRASGLRLSIIAWGRRNKLTPRNSTPADRDQDPDRAAGDVPPCDCGCRALVKRRLPVGRAADASNGAAPAEKKKKKSRLQGGVGTKKK